MSLDELAIGKRR